MNDSPNEASGTTPTGKTPAKPRRRWLRYAAIGAVVAGLGAGLGFKAIAHGGGPHGWMAGAHDPAKSEAHLERMLRHLYVEIDATEAQQAKLAPILRQAAKDLLPLREEMRNARSQALGLLKGDAVDRAAIEALRAGQLKLADDASRRLSRAIGDVAEVLTPAQRKAIAERIEERRRRWHRG